MMRHGISVGDVTIIVSDIIAFIGLGLRIAGVAVRERVATTVERILGRARRRSAPRKVRPVFVAVLLLALLVPLFNILVTRSVHSRVYASASEVPNRYAAIVLGAKVYRSGRPSIILADRLQSALELYNAGKVRRILVSGDHGSASYDEVTAMHDWLRKRGVPSRDIFLDHAGFRTFDTMARAAEVFGVKDAVVCTQGFHLSRALFLAESFGIDAVGLVSDHRPYHRHYLNHAREFVARAVAVLDAYVWYREPRFLGEKIAIQGDGRLTR